MVYLVTPVRSRDLDAQCPDWYSQLGTSHSLPPNWKPATPDEVRYRFYASTPILVESRRMYKTYAGEDLPSSVTAELFIWPDRTGLALVLDYIPVTWFKFAVCEHVFKEVSDSMFDHTYTCARCGYSYTTDSSG